MSELFVVAIIVVIIVVFIVIFFFLLLLQYIHLLGVSKSLLECQYPHLFLYLQNKQYISFWQHELIICTLQLLRSIFIIISKLQRIQGVVKSNVFKRTFRFKGFLEAPIWKKIDFGKFPYHFPFTTGLAYGIIPPLIKTVKFCIICFQNLTQFVTLMGTCFKNNIYTPFIFHFNVYANVFC